MHCAGFNSDTYDRYVLGLLEEPDRSQLETQIQEQCPACLTGVQRSMNLWLAFAETLENAEPSEDFRGRIVRIAELSRKVLTFPKNSAARERPSVPISTLVIICAVTCLLLVMTWYAARAWARVDRPNSTVDLEGLAQKLANAEKALDTEKDKRQKAESEIRPSDRSALQSVVQKMKSDEDARLKAEAQVEQLRREDSSANTLVTTLQRSGARLLPMKASEAAAAEKTVGYTILSAKNLVFIGSNLPKPPDGHTYQFWILRSEEPLQVPAGFMPAEASGTWLMHYDDATMLTKIEGVEITDEPIQGDYQKPSGPKLLEAVIGEEN